MRLDFNTFVITGPSSNTVATLQHLGGQPVDTGGKASNLATNCLTDMFKVTNAPNLPEICGTLTGEHGNLLKTQSFNWKLTQPL